MRSWKLGVAFLQVWFHLMATSKTCPALRLISILYLVRGRGVRASWPIFPRNFSFKICDVSGYRTELQDFITQDFKSTAAHSLGVEP